MWGPRTQGSQLGLEPWQARPRQPRSGEPQEAEGADGALAPSYLPASSLLRTRPAQPAEARDVPGVDVKEAGCSLTDSHTRMLQVCFPGRQPLACVLRNE